jgi:hypothetical protein
MSTEMIEEPAFKTNTTLWRQNNMQGANWTTLAKVMIAHIARTSDTPNADPSLTNEILLGPPMTDVLGAMQALVNQHKHPRDHALKPNAIMACEQVLTASHEHFLTNGERDMEKVNKWKVECVKWLKKEFGETNVVSVVLHLDERTPHIHALTVPLYNGVLHASKKTGKPWQMSAIQGRYAKMLKPLGLERGLKGTKIHHTKIKRFYELMEGALAPTQLSLPIEPSPPVGNEVLDVKMYAARVLKEQREIYQQETDTRVATTQVKAVGYDQMKKRHDIITARLVKIQGQMEDISLFEIMSMNGQRPLSGEGVKTYNTPLGKMEVTEQGWENFDTRENGVCTIDLLRHLLTCKTPEAAAWMRDKYNSHAHADQAVSVYYRRVARRNYDKTEPYRYTQPKPAATRDWIEEFLIEKYRLSRDLASELSFDGNVYKSEAGHMVFVAQDRQFGVTGAEIMRNENSIPCMDIGSDLDAGSFRTPPISFQGSKIAVCRSALSALAYRELKGCRVISAFGSTDQDSPEALIKELADSLRKGGSVVIAFESSKEEVHAAMKLKRSLEFAVGDDPILSARITLDIPAPRILANNERVDITWSQVLIERDNARKQQARNAKRDADILKAEAENKAARAELDAPPAKAFKNSAPAKPAPIMPRNDGKNGPALER